MGEHGGMDSVVVRYGEHTIAGPLLRCDITRGIDSASRCVAEFAITPDFARDYAGADDIQPPGAGIPPRHKRKGKSL